MDWIWEWERQELTPRSQGGKKKKKNDDAIYQNGTERGKNIIGEENKDLNFIYINIEDHTDI